MIYLLQTENASAAFKQVREKCPKTEFFLVSIFLYSVRIQKNTDQKKLRIWTLFTQCKCMQVSLNTFRVYFRITGQELPEVAIRKWFPVNIAKFLRTDFL